MRTDRREPRKFEPGRDIGLEERISPSIVLVNPGGNTPQSATANNGQAIEAVNPAGFAPPGQNP